MMPLDTDNPLTRRLAPFSYAQWAQNAAECCLPPPGQRPDEGALPPGLDSGTLTRRLGIPVVLVHLDELPHAPAQPATDTAFGYRELTARENALRKIVLDRARREGVAFADKFWERKWRLWASYANPVCLQHLAADETTPSHSGRPQSGPQNPEKTPPRRRYRVRQAVILLGDRTRSAARDWQFSTGLAEGELQRAPDGPGKAHFTFLHETAHLLQKRWNDGNGFCESWMRERDADRFAFRQLAALAAHPATSPADALSYRETITARRHARALASFLRAKPKPQHWIGAATDDDSLNPYDVRAAGYEIRLRVYCRLRGEKFDAGDLALRESAIRDWPGLTQTSAQKTAAFAALGALLAAGELRSEPGSELDDRPAGQNPANAMTRRMAEDVIAAACYFCPQLLPPALLNPELPNAGRPDPEAPRTVQKPGPG